jgi:DNA polymerase III subunit delta
MKVSGRRIAAFVRQPETDIVLVYGPDEGLVRERADALVVGAIDDPTDAFRLAVLDAPAVAADPARLVDEAAAMSLSGGRRAVRLRGAGDAVTGACESLMAAPHGDTLIVVEAGDLGPRSSLRRLFEGAENAAALPCYVDDRGGIRRLIEESLAADGLKPSAEALEYLTDSLGADRAITRGELAKLSLYMGGPGPLSVEDARASIGDSAATSLDELVLAVGGGDLGGLERSLDRVFSEGASPIAILRAVIRHFQRLHLAAGHLAAGKSPDQAMATLKPPVFFKARDTFRAQLGRWPNDRLARALEMLTEAELDCKSSGPPPTAICGRALLRIAQAARRPDNRGRS